MTGTGKSLVSAGACIAVGMVAGRAIGLLRETMIAARFGTGSEASIAIALLIIPDFIASALIAGSAAATLIPAFSSRHDDEAASLLWQALLSSAAFFSIIALALATQEDALSHLFSGTSISGDGHAFYLVFATLPLTASTWVITAWLQYRRRFLAPAFANAIFNVVVVLTLWLAPLGLTVLACGIVAASILRLLAHLIAFFRSGGHVPPSPFSPWQLRRRLFAGYAATTGTGIAGMLPQYAPYAVMAAAGGIAIFNYAFKLVMLPGMLLQTIVQMVLLPWFVSIRENHHESRNRIYAAALQTGWILSFCLCLALSLAAHPLSMLCFGYGRMTPENIHAVGMAFAVGVWAVPGMVLTMLWQQILYAHEHTTTPLMASLLQSLLILPLCWLGQRLAGTPGALLGFAVIQTLPVFLLARQGVKRGMVVQLLPGRTTLMMTAASLVVFLAMAAPLQVWMQQPLAAAALTGLTGMAALAAGIAVNPPVRRWAMEQVKRA
ncbi:MAG: hypothetical protein KGJ21_01320 [Pseudomonadota bacterium]|nr:hypothetical protein [Pseudomonadota bacterium]